MNHGGSVHAVAPLPKTAALPPFSRPAFPTFTRDAIARTPLIARYPARRQCTSGYQTWVQFQPAPTPIRLHLISSSHLGPREEFTRSVRGIVGWHGDKRFTDLPDRLTDSGAPPIVTASSSPITCPTEVHPLACCVANIL